jgi:hypothetical protein
MLTIDAPKILQNLEKVDWNRYVSRHRLGFIQEALTRALNEEPIIGVDSQDIKDALALVENKLEEIPEGPLTEPRSDMPRST